MKGFTHTGFWWDPRDPGTKWPGTLTFDPETGARLARTVPFDLREFFGPSREFDLIHGETTSGLKISLLHSFEGGDDEIFANAVIVGIHAEEPALDTDSRGHCRASRRMVGTSRDRARPLPDLS